VDTAACLLATAHSTRANYKTFIEALQICDFLRPSTALTGRCRAGTGHMCLFRQRDGSYKWTKLLE
jgi:hypothetical protein